MTAKYQILALTEDGRSRLQAQIDQYESRAFETVESLKERFLLWSAIKKAWPTVGQYTPYKSLPDLTGKSLYNQNDSVNRVTAQFIGMIQKLMKAELYIVGYTTDGGQSIQLGAITAAKYRQIKAEQGLSGLFAVGIWIIAAAVVAIAGLITYKHLERGLDLIATENDNAAKGLDLKFVDLYNNLKATDPAKADLLWKWWQKKKAAAKAADSRSWWDKATDSIKTIGVSGFGGMALGLVLAIWLASRTGKKRR
jgi:hypothetical protein